MPSLQGHEYGGRSDVGLGPLSPPPSFGEADIRINNNYSKSILFYFNITIVYGSDGKQQRGRGDDLRGA